MGWRERVADRLFGDVIQQRVENAVQVVDDEYWSQVSGGPATLDETWTDHKEGLDDALEAWRTNPLARRIVALTTDYVVGSGIVVSSEIEWVQRFVDEFWKNNGMERRCYDWCDELSRTGELFVVMHTDDVSGASFVRSVPATRIDQVETDANDLERKLRYHELVRGEIAGRWWYPPESPLAYTCKDADAPANGRRDADAPANGRRDADAPANGRRDADAPANGRRDADAPANGRRDADAPANGRRDADALVGGMGNGTERAEVMLHYTINRAVGCLRGESDLGPILPWLKRYRDWLENRVRLNKYKTAFLWDVTITGRPGRGDMVRKKRFRYKTAPEPGSIIVHDDAEKWEAVAPRIDAWDAKEDGKAIRLAIAAGAGIPLHFLGEGESATRATALEMGDPTYRHYYRRQLEFGGILTDLLTVAVRRANARGRGKPYGDLKLHVKFPDVTKGDNFQMAQSAAMMARAVESMARMGIIDVESAVSLILRSAGELMDVSEVLARVRSAGAVEVAPAGGGAPAGRPAGEATGLDDVEVGRD